MQINYYIIKILEFIFKIGFLFYFYFMEHLKHIGNYTNIYLSIQILLSYMMRKKNL